MLGSFLTTFASVSVYAIEKHPNDFWHLFLANETCVCEGGVCLVKKGNSMEDSDSEGEELLPFITAWEASGQSRLTNEFDVQKLLGKGGFGDVIKVNK